MLKAGTAGNLTNDAHLAALAIEHGATICMLDRGADVNWIPPWENVTPMDATARENANELVQWLRARGAKPATEVIQ